MRLLVVILAVCGCSLLGSGAASGYPWPVRPFYEQHPVRANFGDPRTVYLDNLFAGGPQGPGTFLFHNGIDIVAPDGSNVYPVVSGTVRVLSGDGVAVTAGHRTFQYFHLVPTVITGEHVIAQRSLLGYIRAGAGHVHLSEIRGYHVWNPLAKGGIAPYQDLTDPTVRAIYVRRFGTLEPLDPQVLCGRVAVVADAYDTQSEPVPGAFAGFPVAPARITWSLTRGDGTRRLASLSGTIDFRTTLPSEKQFWNVYARGSYQNGPRFGRRQYRMAGLFLYQLTHPGGLDTRTMANGRYRITVHAYDIKGNEGRLVRDIRVANDPAFASGCRPPASPPRQP